MLWPKQKFQSALFPDITLSSSRIYMRPPRMEDWPAWAQIRAFNKDHLRPFEPRWGDNALQRDYFSRRLQRQSVQWRSDQARAFLVFKNDDESLIGGMNINNISRGAAQFASLGYWLDKSHEGQGYMIEAMRLTLQYCFEDLALHRINCSCLPENERSKKLLLNAGFEEEGFAKKYIQIDGKWQDHILFGLPVESWEKA